MNDQERATLLITLTSDFVTLIRSLDPSWTRAFYRFEGSEQAYGSNASYETREKVELVSSVKYGNKLRSINEVGLKIMNSFDKTAIVFLLVVDSQMKYDFKFEYQDLRRWETSKMNGKTGVPVGL